MRVATNRESGASQTLGRFRVPTSFWSGVQALGISPAAVLGRAQLPVTLYNRDGNSVTAAQYFSLWGALAGLSEDPAAGLQFVERLEIGQLSPSHVAAFHARNY